MKASTTTIASWKDMKWHICTKVVYEGNSIIRDQKNDKDYNVIWDGNELITQKGPFKCHFV